MTTSPLQNHALGNNGYVPSDTDFKLDAVFDAAATTAPSTFGTPSLNWGMLGNDQVGDCLVASAAHEVMAEAHAAGRSPLFSTANILRSYSAWTGYVQGDSSTDQGTDPVASAKNRQKEGVLDSAGRGHKIGAYAFEQAKDYGKILNATYAFTSGTGCFDLPYSAEENFNDNWQPGDEIPVWDYEPRSSIAGGHAIALIGSLDGQLIAVSWGKPVIITAAFIQHYLQCVVYYVSGAALLSGDGDRYNPVTGLDIATIRKLLTEVR